MHGSGASRETLSGQNGLEEQSVRNPMCGVLLSGWLITAVFVGDARPQHQVLDLGTLGLSARAREVSSLNHVAGESLVDANTVQGFVWNGVISAAGGAQAFCMPFGGSTDILIAE